MQFARLILISSHVLAGAAWFGAMLYSLAVLHPRARSYFGDARRFEEFIAHLAAGARWKVLGGCLFIALTGAGLMMFSAKEQVSTAWWTCLAIKTVLFLMAVGLFCFTSWVLWPARILSAPQDASKYQQRFRAIAISLLILVGMSMAVGVASSHL